VVAATSMQRPNRDGGARDILRGILASGADRRVRHPDLRWIDVHDQCGSAAC
jgi:hypothetical protein